MEFRYLMNGGNQVFFRLRRAEGWDNAKAPQPEGAYEYTLEGKTTDNESIKMHGIVTLVR